MIAWRAARVLVAPLRAARALVGLAALAVLHAYASVQTRAAARRAGVDPDASTPTPPRAR